MAQIADGQNYSNTRYFWSFQHKINSGFHSYVLPLKTLMHRNEDLCCNFELHCALLDTNVSGQLFSPREAFLLVSSPPRFYQASMVSQLLGQVFPSHILFPDFCSINLWFSLWAFYPIKFLPTPALSSNLPSPGAYCSLSPHPPGPVNLPWLFVLKELFNLLPHCPTYFPFQTHNCLGNISSLTNLIPYTSFWPFSSCSSL